MKPNYRAWEIRTGDFFEQKTTADKMRFLLRFAVLAPSGHNTQPWNFSIKENEISLWVNRERSLEESDPHGHQLFIAFGCMIENLCLAADYYGMEAKITYFPVPQNFDLVARVLLSDKQSSKKDMTENLISAISLRQTNRSRYTTQLLPKVFIDRLGHYEDNNISISVIAEKEKKNIIADIVTDAQIEAMESPSFREELSHYIKSSFTKEHTGMPGFALEIPAPISVFASHLIKWVNLSKQTRRKDKTLLKEYTPAFLIISTPKNNPEQWLSAGRIFERIWLMAVARGISCSPFAGVIQSPSYAGQLKKNLGIDFEPQVFSRIGYAEKTMGHSPRFSIDQLIRN